MKHRSLKKRLLALATTVLTLVMCMAGTMSASAANVAATGGTTTFNKYLVMDENANVPNVTFTFSIVAGDAVSASDGNPAIYAGIGNPTVGSATFSASNTAYGTVQDGDSVTLDTNEKYAKQTVTVDFTGVTFSAPGIYRYIITETDSSASGITNDSTATRTLDVYVRYQSGSESQLEVAGYVMYKGTVTGNTDLNDSDTKSTSYTNNYNTSNLTLTKNVTGNQGDRDKYFEFTVEITNAVAGTKYNVTSEAGSNIAIVDGIGAYDSDAGTLTATNGSVKFTCQLKHNQSIVIQGLTSATQYAITETSYAAEGYNTSYQLDDGQAVANNTISAQSMGTASHAVVFTNAKEGTVPTGVLLETAPYIILGVVVIAGFVVLFATRRRRSR